MSSWPEATTTIDAVYAEAQTGDIIMFQGQGADAGVIRLCSPTDRWSHVGIVVVLRSGQKYITEAYADVIEVEDRRTGRVVPAVDALTGHSHTGLQTVDLWGRLRAYKSHKLAFRKLESTDKTTSRIPRAQFAERFRSHHADLRRRFGPDMPQYNLRNRFFLSVLADWYEYGTRTDDDDNGGRYVCTQWAHEVLQKMGVVAVVDRPGNALLADFGNKYLQPPGIKRYQWMYGDVQIIAPPPSSRA